MEQITKELASKLNEANNEEGITFIASEDDHIKAFYNNSPIGDLNIVTGEMVYGDDVYFAPDSVPQDLAYNFHERVNRSISNELIDDPDYIEQQRETERFEKEMYNDAHTFTIELPCDDIAILIAANVVSREEMYSTHAIGRTVNDFIHTDVMNSVHEFVNFAESQNLEVIAASVAVEQNIQSKINVVFNVKLSDEEICLLQKAAILSGEQSTDIEKLVRHHDPHTVELNSFVHNYVQNSCRDIIENIKSGYGNDDDFNKDDFIKVYLKSAKSSDEVKDCLLSNFCYSEWSDDNKSFSVLIDDLDRALSMMARRGIQYRLEGGNFIEPIKAASFINDEEKMRDFKELSKEEFLESYSYLTEEEYDLTAKDVAKRDIQRIDGCER